MGKTSPSIAEQTVSEETDEWIADLEDYRQGLRHENQEGFDRLTSRARLHRFAMGGVDSANLDTMMILNILLTMQRELDAIRESELVGLGPCLDARKQVAKAL